MNCLRIFKLLVALSLADGTTSIASDLTDYGAAPRVAMPKGAELAADQKLDFHTDLFTGRFNYTIPIVIPPARGGFEPSIALAYDSSAKNGWCGVGWDLDIGYIQRETRFGVPVFGNSYSDAKGFVFSFAGYSGRLVKVSSSGGTDLYLPEINTAFLTFRYNVADGSWTATDKGGKVYSFGTADDSRLRNPTYGTFKWALTKVRDPNGNVISVSYQKSTPDDGQLYPLRIAYNANDNVAAPISANCAVVFGLEARDDVPSSCLAGFNITTSRRLANITVEQGGSRVRRYVLTYISSQSTGRSALASLAESGPTDSDVWPTISFGYSAQSGSFETAENWTIVPHNTSDPSGYAPGYYDGQLIDINGDGLPDWVKKKSASPYDALIVQRNTGSGFSTETAWSTLKTEENNLTAVWNTVEGSTVDSLGKRYWVSTLTDIDGDLLPDRVMRKDYPDFTYLQVQKNTGAGFSSSISRWTGLESNDPFYSGLWVLAPCFTTYDGIGDVVLMTDINGDGLADRVMRGSVSGRLDIQLNRPEQYFSSIQSWSGIQGSGPEPNAPRSRDFNHVYAELMDMNGDGLPDRVIANGVQLNNGVGGFEYPQSWGYSGDPQSISQTEGAYTTQLIDMNGDGLPDRVTSGGGSSFQVQFNTGSRFASSSQSWTGVDTTGDGGLGWNRLQAWDAYGTKVMFMDMNGDGLIDRVMRKSSATSYFIRVQLASGPIPDLLTNINNGIGGVVTVAFTNSSRFNNSDGTRSRLPFPEQVVASVKVSDGIRAAGTTIYSYTNGFFDTDRREFRGFGIVEQTDPIGVKATTWFHQGGGTNAAALGEFEDSSDTPAKAGMAFRVETRGSDNALYIRELHKVAQTTIAPGVYFPFVQRSIHQDAGASGYYRARAEGFAYDVVANNLAVSTGNLLWHTNYSEVTNVNLSTHTFSMVSGAPPWVYAHYTYADIPGNPDIKDRVASKIVSADPAGNAVLEEAQYTYFDLTGNLETKRELICPGSYATTDFGYDPYGNIQTTITPDNVAKTSDYEPSATFPWRTYTGRLQDNLVEYALHDPRTGAVLSATNWQGLVTEYSYDGLFRLTQTSVSTEPFTTPTVWRERRHYLMDGIYQAPGGERISKNYIDVVRNDPSDTAYGEHNTYIFLSGMGRPIQTREEAENGQYRVGNVFFNGRGDVSFETYPAFIAGANYSVPVTSTNVYTSRDALGRVRRITPLVKVVFNGGLPDPNLAPVEITGDLGSRVGPVSFGYLLGANPWVILTTNALGQAQRFYLDAYGRTNSIVQLVSGAAVTTTLAYDPVGNLTNITDDAHQSISFFYNYRGQMVAMADPNMGFWQYGRDRAGRLKTQTDAKGQEIRCFYEDPAGRLTRREGWTGGKCVSVNTFQYDSNRGDAECTVYPGQIYSITDDEGWIKYSYDVRGRTLKSIRSLTRTGQTYTSQTAFDDADRVADITYPAGGPVIHYSYDTGGNLLSVREAGGTGTTFFAAKGFTALRQSLGGDFGNGVQTVNDYYPVSHRLRQIATSKSTAVYQSLTYQYDVAGNITNVSDAAYSGAASGGMMNIKYDDYNRLKSLQNAAGTFSWIYDSVGNMTQNGEGSGTYSYNPNNRPQAVTSANGLSYLYDMNGNVVMKGGMRLAYDVNNRLSYAVPQGTTPVSYGYAADGARLWKRSGENLQVWIGSIYEEKGGQSLYHVYAGERLVCTFDKDRTLLQYYHQNNLTSTSVQTDQAGAAIQHYEYSAYGRNRYTQSSTAFSPSRRYTSQILDDETGLYYYNFRYYDPQLARFLQPDDSIPDLSNPQSYNRYSYCLNNPLRYTDPTGHWPDVIDYLPFRTAYLEIHGQNQLDAMVRAHTEHGSYAQFMGSRQNATPTAGDLGAVSGVAHGAASAADAYTTALPDLATAGLATAVPIITKVGRATEEEVVTKGTRILENGKRGRASEAGVLNELGQAKNTEKVLGKEGASIPDFQSPTTVGEIKDSQRVTDSRQLRIQKEAAQQSARAHELHTGVNTAVSQKAAQGTTVIRRPDLGPSTPAQ